MPNAALDDEDAVISTTTYEVGGNRFLAIILGPQENATVTLRLDAPMAGTRQWGVRGRSRQCSVRGHARRALAGRGSVRTRHGPAPAPENIRAESVRIVPEIRRIPCRPPQFPRLDPHASSFSSRVSSIGSSPTPACRVVAVLERLGITVECPAGQTCCGQPAFNGGYLDEARALARHTIDLLSATDDPIVIPSGSCGDMVIHQYEAIFRDDPVYLEKARAIHHRAHEFTQFLVNVLGVTDVGAVFPQKVAYHACCHGLRGLGAKDEPRVAACRRRPAERCPLAEADVCCGFGGLFSVKCRRCRRRCWRASSTRFRKAARTRSSSPT